MDFTGTISDDQSLPISTAPADRPIEGRAYLVLMRREREFFAIDTMPQDTAYLMPTL